MKRTETGRVGVIGGGLGGLAAACTLAARGYEVLLLEKNAWLGGKAAVLEADGFRFDDLAPGRYAVAVFHDVNGNGELDRIPPGVPTEPYGFSNGVGRFAPPNFQRALVPVGGGETTVVVSLGRLFGAG